MTILQAPTQKFQIQMMQNGPLASLFCTRAMGHSDNIAYLEALEQMVSKVQAESIGEVNELLSYFSKDHLCLFLFFTCRYVLHVFLWLHIQGLYALLVQFTSHLLIGKCLQ